MDSAKSLIDQQKQWCVHFTGIQHDCCALGIEYKTVRLVEPGQPYRFPCLSGDGCPERCAQTRYPTQEEAEAREAEIQAFLARMIEDVKAGNCPHCHTPIQAKRQVGRCIYAHPCGCRLGQGRLKP